MIREVDYLTRGTRRRALLTVSRARVYRIDEADKLQYAQTKGYAGETTERLEAFQRYGFSSVPIPSPALEAVILAVGGNRNHGFALGIEDRLLRPRGQPAGDTMLYTEQDDPEAEAVDALHRLQGTRDRTWVIRGQRVDIRCGPTRIEMDETGITITTPRLDIVKA